MSIKKIFPFLILLLFASTAHAAITFDATSSSPFFTSSSTMQWAHTVGAGSNSVLIVVATQNNSSTGVSYDGMALTKIIQTTIPADGSERTEIWYLVNPPSGTHNVSTTFSSAFTAGQDGSYSFFGVSQTNPIDATGTFSIGSGNTASITLTPTVAGDEIIDGISLQTFSQTNFAAKAGQTLNYSTPLGGGGNPGAASSYKTNPTSLATSTGYTWTGLETVAQAAVSLLPATSNPSAPSILSIASGKLTVAGGTFTIQ